MNQAQHAIELARQFPYSGIPPIEQAELAACAVLVDLCDRKGIKQELEQVGPHPRVEIVAALANIIELAMKPPEGNVQTMWQRMGDAQPEHMQRILYRENGIGHIFECPYDPRRQKWQPSDTWILRDKAMTFLAGA